MREIAKEKKYNTINICVYFDNTPSMSAREIRYSVDANGSFDRGDGIVKKKHDTNARVSTSYLKMAIKTYVHYIIHMNKSQTIQATDAPLTVFCASIH